MSSPAAARASASVPVAASAAPEVSTARVSVSSPTWFSRGGPAETLGARWSPKADQAASPLEGMTSDKAAGPREGTAADKPAASTAAMAETAAPGPNPAWDSSGSGATPTTDSKAPAAR